MMSSSPLGKVFRNRGTVASCVNLSRFAEQELQDRLFLRKKALQTPQQPVPRARLLLVYAPRIPSGRWLNRLVSM